MDSQRIRLYTKSFGVLGPVRQIASNKTVSVSSDPVSFQLDQQCAMVNCVEGLTKFYKYTKYMFFLFNGVSYDFYGVVNCMASGMRLSKTKLVFVKNVL